MIRNGEVTMNDSVWVGTAYEMRIRTGIWSIPSVRKPMFHMRKKPIPRVLTPMGTGGIRKMSRLFG
jgi:hypothetical protein